MAKKISNINLQDEIDKLNQDIEKMDKTGKLPNTFDPLTGNLMNRNSDVPPWEEEEKENDLDQEQYEAWLDIILDAVRKRGLKNIGGRVLKGDFSIEVQLTQDYTMKEYVRILDIFKEVNEEIFEGDRTLEVDMWFPSMWIYFY